MDSDKAHQLAEAFRRTDYIVFLPEGDITLHIGEHNLRLSRLLAAHNTNSMAIITAYNPNAKTVPLPTNQSAQSKLEAEVERLGHTVLRGQNRAPDGDGPAEPTVAVLGISSGDAAALAARHEQLAFVFADARAKPALMWKEGDIYTLLR